VGGGGYIIVLRPDFIIATTEPRIPKQQKRRVRAHVAASFVFSGLLASKGKNQKHWNLFDDFSVFSFQKIYHTD
jgi:hypothetical protein